MDAATQLTFTQLGISALLGMLVGLQRQRSESVLAGMRTFPMITLLGTVSALLDQRLESHGWMIASGFIGVAAIVVVTNIVRATRAEDLGTTTEMATLLMFAVGAYLVVGTTMVAVSVGATVAVLLQFKDELHGFVARLGDNDLRAIMTFVLISGVVLPVLPNETYNAIFPLNVVNPFETWLMVVLMVGISLSGYLLYKFLGQNAGVLLGGILGGAISSTATTLSYARRSVADPNSRWLSALIIMIASTVVYFRVILEIVTVAPSHAKTLVPPIAIILGVTGAVSLLLWIRLRSSRASLPPQKNPTELGTAIVFGLMYAGVLMALAAAKKYFDDQGMYVVAALSGLTDMDAITLSTARLVTQSPNVGGIRPDDGWRIIVVASMSNLFFKSLLVAAVSMKRLFIPIVTLFLVPSATATLLLLYWP